MVISGFVAVPIMVAVMMVVSSKSQIKEFIAPLSMRVFGWGATAVMALAAAAMFIV